ncbi:MAG: zinc-ribbon domain-containing protein [Chloroflexi bacterium]|nr:MAG: zinc-ribbon domain-containing protein [Chloroflexota bacterium]
MRCPRCGNEASQEEPFCGQCGAPTEQQIYRTNNVSFTPHQPMQPPSDPNQQTRFYQDATEAISIYPKQAGPAYPTAYQRDPNACRTSTKPGPSPTSVQSWLLYAESGPPSSATIT